MVFCDLVDSTPLSQQLDAEDLREVVDAYQRACGEVVLHHEGFVAQYLGDGILVYFGYPQAHEDDPSRAARCALQMLGSVEQVAHETGIAIQARIGIHSGRVVVGSLGGSARSERLAVGDTPNIAARVQSHASPGEIVVSDSFRRLLPDSFVAEPLAVHTLKGVARPVELYRILSNSGQTTGSQLTKTPYIGRERERELIEEMWAHSMSGVPRFAVLRGEPGIGKSRLLEVVRTELADDRTDVLGARCTPFTTDTAFHSFTELIRSRLSLENASTEESIERIENRMTELGLASEESVPLLAAVLGIPVDPKAWPEPALSPARARQRTMDILIEAIQILSRRSPVLLVVEDLHWADPSTVELLHQLIGSARTGRLMGIFTARPEFNPSWTAATNVTAFELDALSGTEAQNFIRTVAKNKLLPPEVVWQIQERAAGNPLFLEEITHSVIDSGGLVEREDSWELVGPLSADVVPPSMEAALTARIDRLGEARSLLQLGATLGREFSHELLEAIAPSSAETLDRQVEQLLESGLIFRQAGTPPVYTIKHALVRDAAYDSLLRSTRQRYHAQIAEALITQFSNIGENRPEILAHHLSGAQRYAEAAARWQAAGERAAKRSAVIEAVAHFRRALADLELLPEDAARMDRELSVLTALAPALMAVYGWAAPEVGTSSERAIRLAEQLEAHDRMYAPLWGLWTNQFVGGRLKEGMESGVKVLEMALATGSPMLEVTGRHATAFTRYYRGEFDAALAEAEAGLALYSTDQELEITSTFQLSSTVSILMAKGGSLWMQGRQDEGIAVIEEMLSLALKLRHPPSIAAALAYQMFFFVYDRDWMRTFDAAERLFELAQTEGFAMWTANAGMHRGHARVGLGEEDAGVAEVLEWGAVFRQTGSGVIESSTTSMMTQALHKAGRSVEALAVSHEGARRAHAGMTRVMESEIYRVRGDILRDVGRLDDADEAFRHAVACARDQGALSLELRALTSLLDLCIERGSVGDTPGELRDALRGMACNASRPDLLAGQKLLSQVQA